jgi:hypothetical protein
MNERKYRESGFLRGGYCEALSYIMETLSIIDRSLSDIQVKHEEKPGRIFISTPRSRENIFMQIFKETTKTRKE